MDADRFGLRAYARACAQALHWGYVDPGPERWSDAYARLRDPETHAEVALFCGYYQGSMKGRVRVSCVFPEGAGGGDVIDTSKAPVITVRMDLGPHHFADEVRRRLLPGFWPLWREAVRRSTASLIEDDDADAVLGELLEAIPGGSRSQFGKSRHHGSVYAQGLTIRIDVWRPEEVDIEISHVPAEHARKIAEILADAVRQRNDRDG